VDTGVTSLNELGADSQNLRFSGIVVDGKLLVDAVNDSQAWSKVLSTPTGNFDGDPSNAFDGDLTTRVRGKEADGEPVAEITFQPTGLSFTDSFEVYVNIDNINAGSKVLTLVTDAGTQAVISTSLGAADAQTNVWVKFENNPGEVTSFSIPRTPGVGNNIFAFKVDGKLLVDTGTDRGLGDTEVTYGPVTGTGTFQVADQLNNTMTIQNSNDRWIDNNNRLSKDFYVRDNITVLNADNAKHVALQQAIADAFDAFPEKVNERRTSIASSFYRLMGGEALSAGEFQLLEETVIGAVNATEPFALDGFYPLYYTSAKADAASSTDSHHSHTINGVTYYMPDGGTLYHGNYIAPETASSPAPTPAPTPTPTPEPTPDFDSGDSSY
jgi:hypothetical protein